MQFALPWQVTSQPPPTQLNAQSALSAPSAIPHVYLQSPVPSQRERHFDPVQLDSQPPAVHLFTHSSVVQVKLPSLTGGPSLPPVPAVPPASVPAEPPAPPVATPPLPPAPALPPLAPAVPPVPAPPVALVPPPPVPPFEPPLTAVEPLLPALPPEPAADVELPPTPGEPAVTPPGVGSSLQPTTAQVVQRAAALRT